jgi:hypothetical protein
MISGKGWPVQGQEKNNSIQPGVRNIAQGMILRSVILFIASSVTDFVNIHSLKYQVGSRYFNLFGSNCQLLTAAFPSYLMYQENSEVRIE